MGGRGTYAVGKPTNQYYKTVGSIKGVKVLQGIDKQHHGMPEEAKTSKAYIILYPDGNFKRYREFSDDHTAKFDIDFHAEQRLTGNREKVYHIHFYPDGKRDRLGRLLTEEEYKKYKKYFRGMK